MSAVYLQKDMKYTLFRRKVVDILTVLADTGGLKEFIVVFGRFIVSYWASKLFLGSIVHKVYQTRNYKEIQQEARDHTESSSTTNYDST